MNRYLWHPDNNDQKTVYLQAAGKQYEGGARHVLLAWSNGTFQYNGNRTSVRQVIQLTQDGAGYHYDLNPVAELFPLAALRNNTFLPLGTFTRLQRDRILQLAQNTPFVSKSTVNGCRVWTRDLLEAMMNEGMISQEIFEQVDHGVPLVKRMVE